MHKVSIVFMGTPDFAVESLKKLYNSGIHIAAVITSSDKQSGRGLKITESAVKKFAVQNNLKVLQPANLKDPDFISSLRKLNANLFIVVAFRMLPEIVWGMPVFGTINLHASVLPHYRGAAPINWAIINGEKETGVTTFFIEKEIDTGNIIKQQKVKIDEAYTAGDLHDKLMITGAELLLETVLLITNKKVQAFNQNVLINSDKLIKSAPKIFKTDCKINWSNSTVEIYNFIRGLSPFPCSFTEIVKNDQVQLLKIFLSNKIIKKHKQDIAEINSDNKTYIHISTKDGYINISELQLQGKKRMKTEDFLKGFDISNCTIKA